MQAAASLAMPLPSLRNFRPCAVPGSLNFNNARRGAELFTRTSAVIGIDLGTTNSAIAYVGTDGPEVIRDADGHATIPSVVVIKEVSIELMYSDYVHISVLLTK